MIFGCPMPSYRSSPWLLCLIAGLPLICGGCFFAQEEGGAILEQRQGQIIAENAGKRERYNFQYEYDHATQCYHIRLNAPFTPLVELSCYASRPESLRVDVLGYQYEGQEARNILSERLPEFPWEQLPDLIKNGRLNSKYWDVETCENGRLELTHNDGVRLSWLER